MLRRYKLWTPDYNRASNYYEKYPLTEYIFDQPNSMWLTGRPKFRKIVDRAISRLIKRAEPAELTFVLYAIPDRDLGQYSAGGFEAEQEYLNFCKRVALGIGDNKAILVFEPDALPHSTLMTLEKQQARLSLMKKAIDNIVANCSALVYIDVGHSNWLSPNNATALLKEVGIEQVRGFSVNVSNYRTTEECIKWADQICAKFKHSINYIVDTSRNGVGPLGNEWCNPPGRAIGHPPTIKTASYNCDAYLWIKVPGESDGRGNGGPVAGKFWPEQAESMLRLSPYYNEIVKE